MDNDAANTGFLSLIDSLSNAARAAGQVYTDVSNAPRTASTAPVVRTAPFTGTGWGCWPA